MTKMNIALPERSAGTVPRMAIDFGPLLVFFLVNLFAPVQPLQKIFAATAAFMLATAIAMAASKIVVGRVSVMLWFSGVMVLVFGGLTLWLHNETFIKVKPTIYYLTAASLLFIGMWRRQPALKYVLGAAYPGLSERGWVLLSRNWAWFFVGMAIANEIVWRSFTTNEWVGYKIWGSAPASLLFAAGNIPMLMRHGLADDTPIVVPPEE